MKLAEFNALPADRGGEAGAHLRRIPSWVDGADRRAGPTPTSGDLLGHRGARGRGLDRRRGRAAPWPTIRGSASGTAGAGASAAHVRAASRPGSTRPTSTLQRPAGRRATAATRSASGGSTWSAPPDAPPSEMLDLLEQRLDQRPATELAVTKGQLAEIAAAPTANDGHSSYEHRLHPRARRRPRPARRRARRLPHACADGSASRRRRPTPTAGSRFDADLPPGDHTGWPSRPGPGSPAAGRETFFPEVTVAFTVDPTGALPRGPAAQPVRLHDLPRELTMATGDIVLGPNQYGKAECRLVRVDPRHPRPRASRPQGHHRSCAATSRPATPTATTATCFATDTQKNTVYAFARSTASARPRTSCSAGPALRRRPQWVTGGRWAGRAVRLAAHRSTAAARPRLRPDRWRDPHRRRAASTATTRAWSRGLTDWSC